MTSPDPTPSGRVSRRAIVIGVAVVALAAVAAGVWWFFIRDDSPAAFDIDTAAEGAESTDGDDDTADDETGDTGTTDAAGESVDGDVEGVWTIDPDAGADAGGTSAGFRVDEELSSIGANTVVGRTSGVTGNLVIEGTTVTDVEVTVDMASLETDDSRRDGRMSDALAADEFPTASFVLAEPIDLGSIPAPGETISVTATGDLTIKGVTRAVDVALDARLVDGTLVVVGSAPVVFADYGVEAPSAPIVVSVDDNGLIEFQLFFGRG